MLLEEVAEELSLCLRERRGESICLSINLLSRTVDDYHLLAVGSDQIGPVGDNSVEAGAACNHILRFSRYVLGVKDVVARTAREHVLGEFAYAVVDYEVAACSAYHPVGASISVDEVPAFPPHRGV